MLSTQDIILQYVCPSFGMIAANVMFAAPFKDVRRAVSRGTLGSLNPTPWAAMTGNCCGWVTYSYLIQNWFVFWANAPGFILSIWLNMAAAKLQYCDRMSKEMRSSFVKLLESNRRSFVIREEDSCKLSDKDMQEIEKVNNHQVNCEGEMASFENMRKMALEIAIGKTEAPAPHEKVVVALITIWVAVITCICFLDVTTRQKELIIGITVNINLLFFYGAPLSTIFTVLKSRDSGSIHRWTMLMNTANASFWTAFGIGTRDYFILVPNGIGAVFGGVQMILCMVVPSQAGTSSSTNESATIQKVDIELSANAAAIDTGLRAT